MHRTTRFTYLGLVLVVVGLFAAGAGAATHVEERQCGTVQTVVVVPAANATVGEDVPRVNASELPATERRVVESALDRGGTVLTKRGAIDPMVVRYRGNRYAVRVGRGSGCEPFDRKRIVAPAVAGLALFGAGTALVRGRDHPE